MAKAANCKIKLAASRFDKKSSTALGLLTNDIIGYEGLRSYLNITLMNEVTQQERVLSEEECSLEVTSGGFKLHLNVSYQVLEGSIYIRKVRGLDTNPLFDSSQNMEVKDYPLKIPNVVIISSKIIKTAQDGTDRIVAAEGVVKSIVATALMSASPAVAVIMNKVLSEFSYIRLLNGQILIYPLIVLEGFGNMNILPVSFDNPFELWTSVSNCPTNGMLEIFDVKCNLLYNYGTDLVILLFYLAICGAVTIFYTIMMSTVLKVVKRSSLGRKKSLLYKACSVLNDMLGLQFFLVLMEGEAQEILAYAYINISSKLSDMKLHLGAILSLLFIGFYGYYCYAIYILAKQVDKKVKRAKADWIRIEKNETRTLDSVISFDGMRFKRLSFVYDGYKYPITFFQLCYPIFGILRIILICMFLMSFDEAGFTQLAAVMIIEMSFAILNKRVAVKVSQAERVLEFATMVLNCIYISIKMFTFANFDNDTKQYYMGIPMALVLVLLVLASLGFVVVTLFSILAEAVKDYFLGKAEKIDINEKLEKEKEKIRKQFMKRDPNYVYLDDLEIPEKLERRLIRKQGMALAKYKFKQLCLMRNSSSRNTEEAEQFELELSARNKTLHQPDNNMSPPLPTVSHSLIVSPTLPMKNKPKPSILNKLTPSD